MSPSQWTSATPTSLRSSTNTGLRFLVLHDLGKRVSAATRSSQFPETWIIGRDGALASHIVGARDWSAPESLRVFRELLE